MTYRRKTYTSQFEFDRALEVLKNGNISEISRKYNIGANVLSKWRIDLVKQGYRLFETSSSRENKELKNQIAELEQMLGKKEVELNLLKNSSDFYQSETLRSRIRQRPG